MVNPIVTFIFYFGLSLTAILSKTWVGLGLFYSILVFLLLLNNKYFLRIVKSVKPFLIFFPILITIYFFISFIFTNSTWNEIVNTAGMAIAKLFLLVFVMALYLEISKQHNLILSIRSIWSKSNKKWKWVEDLFIFIELTLRFYPTFQREWQNINRAKVAIGLTKSENIWEKIKSSADDLPGMILQSYRKAENTASVMEQRGYGTIIPRGVAHSIPFKSNDLILLVAVTVGFSIINLYAAL